MKKNYENIGLHVPEILLPSKDIDPCKWAVVACDQYTSQPAYWEEVKNIAGDSPSTLKLTFPEIFLKDDDKDERISKINETMDKYLKEGILEAQKPGFIILDRSTAHTPSRKGLMVALDLEKYDYNKGSQSLIRATEGTVLDRIPPRVRIREKAKIELPHIMVLIDDPEKTVIEPLFENTGLYKKKYDFELMQNGGHIKGWMIEDEISISKIASALAKLAQPDVFTNKYGVAEDKGILLFAVGDGNHSLATAKAHWENVKAANKLDGASIHPARYALVELVNVHDEGIVFEPIHRVLFGIDGNKVLEELKSCFNNGSTVKSQLYGSEMEMKQAHDKAKTKTNTHNIPFVLESSFGLLSIQGPSHNLEVGTLQAALDKLTQKLPHMEIDYIHGEEVVTVLGSKKGHMGFYLPAMNKHDLFKTVILEGALPRKTFSMGEADEKRYYLECRKI